MEEKFTGRETTTVIRVKAFVEGQTEETFVRDVLAPYFIRQSIYMTPILAQTSPGHKGGIVSYGKVKRQINHLCKEDSSAVVTTLIDYYGLPADFPKPDVAGVRDLSSMVQHMEKAFADDIHAQNFIPNFLLHEFEALLFCEPTKFAEWLDNDSVVEQLLEIKKQFPTPEHINDSVETAPSKRILDLIPHYKKTLHGPLIAEDIGLDVIRSQCPHFSDWVESISNLSTS